MNIMLRFKNKTVFLSFVTCIIAFSYQLLGILGVVSPISEDTTTQFVAILANILVGLGVLVDPTTTGIQDSEKAKEYKKLNGDDKKDSGW